MTEAKRDQRPFDMVQQYLPGLILNTILETIKERWTTPTGPGRGWAA